MNGTAKKVLIIDDDQRNIFALKAVLRSKGYAVEFAEDAEKGIAMMKGDSAIGIVLLDMMMPGMDGYEALKVIRETEVIAGLPVIAVTAQAMAGDRERCMQAGADGYVSKPVDIDELKRYIDKYLNRSNAPARGEG